MNLENCCTYHHSISGMPFLVLQDGVVIRNFNVCDVADSREVFEEIPAMPDGVDMCVMMTDFGDLVGMLREQSTGKVLVMGPGRPDNDTLCHIDNPGAQFGEYTAAQFLTVLNVPIYRAPEGKLPERTVFPIRIPQLIQMMKFIDGTVNDRDPQMLSIEDSDEVELRKDIESAAQISFLISKPSESLGLMVSLLVENGNVEEIDRVTRGADFAQSFSIDLEYATIEKYRLAFVISLTMTLSSAVRGGMNYSDGMNMLDGYINMVSQKQTYEEIALLWREMLMDYAGHVSEYRGMGNVSPITSKIMTIVSDSIYSKVTVNGVAKKMGFDSSYINRVFKKDTGKTLSRFIIERKVVEAKLLLSSTNMPLKEIALTLGFSSQSHFQGVFKKMMGCTPTHYRCNAMQMHIE